MFKLLKKLMLIAALVVPWATQAQSLGDYTFSTGTDATKWITLVDADTILDGYFATNVAGADSKASSLQDIGFAFPFGMGEYTKFSVNTDGNLRFGNSVTGTANYTTPFTTTNANINNPKINFMGCDGFMLDTGIYKGFVLMQNTENAAGDSLLVVEFATSTYNSNSRQSLLRWQIHLYPSGAIEVVFHSATPVILPNVTRQVGLCIDNTDIWLVDATHVGTHYTSGQTSTIAIGTWPDANRYYSFTPPVVTCPAVANILLDVSPTEVEASWTEMGNATNWLVTLSNATGVVSSQVATTNNVTINQLSPAADYSLSIRAICSSTDTSYERTVSFQTPCVPISPDSLPWLYGFEDASGTGASATFNPCLGRYREGTTSAYPYTSSTQVHTGTYAGYMYSTNAIRSWLTLPPFEDDIEDLYLSFHILKTSANYGHWMVGVMSDPSDMSTFDTIAFGQATTLNTWELVEVPLTTYTGNGTYLTILCPMGAATTNYIYIDDISVGLPPACPTPSDIVASNPTAHTIDLTWTSSASEFIVEYGPQGFIPGTGDSLIANSNSITLNDLLMGVVYGVQVSAICGSDTSNAANATFTTGCGTLTEDDLPYTEDFEAFGSGSTYPINACWHKGVVAITGSGTTTNFPYPYSTAAINGSRGLYFYAGTTTSTSYYNWMVLPPIDESLNMSDLMVNFQLKRTTTTTHITNLVVGVTTDYTSTAGFVPVDTIDLSSAPTGSVHNIEVSFANYTGTGTYVLFYAPAPTTTSTYNAFYVDDITLRAIPNCFWPTDVVVSEVSSEDATIAWTPDTRTSSPDGWNIEYGIHGFTRGNGELEYVTDTTITLTDLLPNTQYDIYVSADCGSDESDATMLTFRTLCTSLDTLPLIETFDSYNSGWGNTPDCWMFLNQSASSSNYPQAYTYSSTTYAVSGNCLYFKSSSTTPIYAILPAIDANLNTLQISFTYRNEGTTASNGTLSLGYMTNPYEDSTFVEVATYEQTTTLTNIEFPFGAYNLESGNYYIAFKYTGGTANNYYLGIDNVTVTTIPTCQRSINLTADSVSYDFAHLTWENYSDFVNSYTVYYSTEEVFSIDTCASVVVYDTVADLYNLAMETDYYWTVVADCGNSDISATPAIQHFRTLRDCGENSINIVDTIGNGTGSSYSYFAYNYTSYQKGYSANIFTAEEMMDMGIMTSADINSVSVHAGTTACTIPNLKVYAGLIDTVHFTGAVDTARFASMQLLYDGSLTTTAGEWITINFDSSYHYDGSSNLMLLFRRSGAPSASGTFYYTTITSNYNTLYGYASSATGNMTATRSTYRVNMMFNMCAEVPTCARPMDVNIVNLSDNGATLSWENLNTNYEYVIGASGFDPDTATAIMVTDTIAVITGLSQSTNYDFYVRSVCSPDLISDWSLMTHFLTPCSAQALPYSEDFESYGSGSSSTISACWTKGTNYSTAYPYPYSTNAISGSRSLYFYSYYPSSATATQIYSYAALPLMQAPVDTLAVSFKMRRYATTTAYYTSRMLVGVMSDPSDISTFVGIDTIDLRDAPASSIHQFEVSFENYTGNGQFIAFYDAVPPLYGSSTYSYSYVYLDDIVVDYIPNCRRILDVTVDTVAETTATISWNDPNNAGIYEIEYGPEGFALGSGTSYIVYNTTETLTGLATSMGYDFYVRAVCGNENAPWSFATNFRTVCGIYSVPFVEDFESYGSGTTYGIDPCWTKGTNYTSTAYPYPSSSNAITGERSLYFYAYLPSSATSTAYYSYVALPEFNVSVDSLELSFKMRRYSSTTDYYTSRVIVGVMTDPDDISTFVGVDTIDLKNEAASSIHDISVVLDSYTGTGKHIAIYDAVPPLYGSASYCYSYTYIDDIIVDRASPCGRPHSLQATPSSNSIALSWVDTVGSSQWQIEYGPTGFEVGTGTIVTVSSNPYTITGLTPSTLYDVYVRSICAGGAVGGNNSGIFTVSTSQVPATLPYYYNFENAAEWANWQTVSNNTVGWYRGTAEAAEGNYSLYVSTDSGATCNSLHSVITNAAVYRDIDFGSTPSSFEVSFLAKSAGINDGNYEGINIMLVDPAVPVNASSTSLTSPWGTFNVVHVVRDTNWNQHTLLFDNISGVHRLVFNWFTSTTTSHPVWNGAGAIDSLVVMEQACVRPTNTTVTNVGSDFVSLQWDGPATDSYLVRLRDVDDATNTNIDNTVTGNSATINSLTPNTSYYVWVYKVCDANSMSYSAPRIQFTTTCIPYNAVDTLYEDFDNVTSAAYNAAGILPDCWEGYSNGTNAAYMPHVTDGNSYSYSITGNPITMTSGSATYGDTKIVRLPKFTEPVNTLTMSYWYCTESSSLGTLYVGYLTGFDYENDFVPVVAHQASNASYHSGNGPQTAGHGVFDTVSFDSVPANAMFIAFKWVYTTSFYSCCIDNVEVTSSGNFCVAPTALPATDITYHGATLNWSSNATDFEVAVKAATDATWPVGVPTSSSAYTIDNLAPATPYQFRVRAICDAAEGLISDWAEGSFVTDSLPCFVPTDLHTTDLGYTNATLAWTADASQNQWSIRVWTSANGTDFEVTSNPYTVTGLVPQTTYYAAVKAICGGGAAESEYSDTIQFTTETCVQVTGVSVSQITENSAVVSWNAVDAVKYEIEYGDRNFNQGTGTTIVVNEGTSYTLTGLLPDYDYSVFVRAFCEEDVDGAWSDQVDFTTPHGEGFDSQLPTANGQLSIFPNPTTDATTIAISGVTGEVEITIVDMNGRTVATETMSCEGDCTKRMEVSTLAQGAYFIRISADSINAVKKLIVK